MVAVLAVGLSLMLTDGVARGEVTAPVERGATTEPQAPAVRGPAGVPDGCEDLGARLASLAEQGHTRVACTRPDVRPDGPGTTAIVPLPSWCQPDGYWWLTRKGTCMQSKITLGVHEVPSGKLTGELTFWARHYSYTSSTSITWAHQITIEATEGWGEGLGAKVQGGIDCTGSCANTRGTFPSQSADPRSKANGEFYVDSTSTARWAIGTASTKVSFWFTHPRWASNSASATAPTVRCDNALPGTSAPPSGCVFRDYQPVMVYSLTGSYPELAAHIRDAQAAGLPGAHGGTPLHRLTDPTLHERNRATACPDSLPRPPAKSCDEYPMASTWEGASTGSGNFSRRMIDDWQNSVGGSALGSFYSGDRVLERDAFTVYIAP
uniref:NucA/NucB deoxyribonuclease domain-containing protein n=1 Tax=Saccharothrix espanaensis TaxID=103731 RepID=UPI003F4975A2